MRQPSSAPDKHDLSLVTTISMQVHAPRESRTSPPSRPVFRTVLHMLVVLGIALAIAGLVVLTRS